MRDQDVLQAVSDGLSGLDMDTPAEEIIAVGSSRRRRRLVAMAVAGLAVAAGIAVGLPALVDSGPAGPPVAGAPAATHQTSVAPPKLAAFTVVSNPNGTVTLSLSRTLLANPDAVRDALSRAGVPANVRVGSACYSVPAPPGVGRVFSGRGEDPSTVLVIDPSAIPSGAVVTIGYHDLSSGGPIIFGLAWADRMTC